VRLPWFRVAIALTIVFVLLVGSGIGASRGPGSEGPAATPAGSTNLTSELNLNDGQDFVSPGVSYNGFYNSVNTSFPVLLTGSNESEFWSLDQPVLDVAPQQYVLYAHDAGLMMFNGGTASQWEVSADAVTSSEFNGDGVSFYFLLSPLSTAGWNSQAYFESVTDGPSLAQCSGDQIFPFSSTPYFVVQWEPAYKSAYCGIGSAGEFNVFTVDPSRSGVVSAGSISALGPIGVNSTSVPGVHDVFNVTAAYEAVDDELQATVVDASTASDLADLSLNLNTAGFVAPSDTPTPSYLAVSEGGSQRTGWGLEYVGYATAFEPLNTTLPVPTPSPPFTANFTTEVNLNGARNVVSPDLSYQSYYDGVNTSFPALLTGAAKGPFETADPSVLELAPDRSGGDGAATGMLLFSGGSTAQWEITADAVTAAQLAGNGVAFYFMLTPTTTANWSANSYIYAPQFACAGDLILPFSTTPYFVVQWEPVYANGGCGAGLGGEFNIYSVNPLPSGVVTDASVSGSIGPIGTSGSIVPGVHDVFNVTVGYKANENELEARAIDVNTSQVLSYIALDLVEAVYIPPYEASIPAYLAVSEGSDGQSAWGLEYAGYTTWTQKQNSTEPPSFLTPPVTSVVPPPAPTPLTGASSSSGWTPLFEGLAVAAVLAIAVFVLAVIPIRKRKLRREGEELVAGMDRLISEGEGPPRSQ
jgi:hypothetical protein